MKALFAFFALLFTTSSAGSIEDDKFWPFTRRGQEPSTTTNPDPLIEQEEALADDVREQAAVVANTSDDLTEKKEYAEGLPTYDALEEDAAAKKKAEQRAQAIEYKYLAYSEQLEYQRDALKNSTDETEDALSRLVPKLEQTQKELDALLAMHPVSENSSEGAEDATDSASTKLAYANAGGAVAASNVALARFKLQREVDTLNEINDRLVEVQDILYGESAGIRSGVALYLLVLLCGAVLRPHLW